MREKSHEVHYACENCGSICFLSSEEYDGDTPPSCTCPYNNGHANWHMVSVSKGEK
jgi:hypothetical protein